jgi:hypothetical protein
MVVGKVIADRMWMGLPGPDQHHRDGGSASSADRNL